MKLLGGSPPPSSSLVHDFFEPGTRCFRFPVALGRGLAGMVEEDAKEKHAVTDREYG